MAIHKQFRLHTEMRFEADNPAVEAILMVIEENFGTGAVQSTTDADGTTRAHLRIDSEAVDARLVNWLHARLAKLSKYLLAPAIVDCADDTRRESAYRIEPSPIDGDGAGCEPSNRDDTAEPA